MTVSRREALKLASGGVLTGLLGAEGLLGAQSLDAAAEGGRVLGINLFGYTLGIHVPAISAVHELLPNMPGYAAPKIALLERPRVLTQTLVAGAAEIVQTDPITVFRAVESGADLRIIGNVYLHTSLVFVANADRVRELKDLEKPNVTVAVAGKGDITHVMLFGPLLKRGIDPKKITMLEVGGSGARMRALLSKRVDAVPMHFDQAAQTAKQGNFRILFEPWKEYKVWVNEIWAVNAAWLRKPENQRVTVDLMKAVITGSRRANTDFGWYLERYRRHATIPKAAEATEEEIRPLWRELAQEVKAWPPSNDFTPDHFRELLPVYKAADAIVGTVKVERVVDPTYVEQAVKELGD